MSRGEDARQETRVLGTGGMDRRATAARIGFTSGVLAVGLAGLLACAGGGAKAPAVLDEGTPPDAVTAPPASPPAAAPAPTAAPEPPAEPAAVAGSDDSPVAGYLADGQAVTRGAQLFRAVCTGYCHSTQPTAERVAPNLFDCDWDHGGSDREVFHSIAAGVPDTQMQGFGERLPEEDLWKIVAYLRQRTTCKE